MPIKSPFARPLLCSGGLFGLVAACMVDVAPLPSALPFASIVALVRPYRVAPVIVARFVSPPVAYVKNLHQIEGLNLGICPALSN